MNSVPNQPSTGLTRSNLTRSPTSPRTLFSTVMTVLAFVCGVLALLPLLAVLSYVLIKGFSSLNLSIFTDLPPVAGQLQEEALAMRLSEPSLW